MFIFKPIPNTKSKTLLGLREFYFCSVLIVTGLGLQLSIEDMMQSVSHV